MRLSLLPRPGDGHKGTFGHALIIAGSWGMAGASVLAAKACLRSGVGKVTVHIPQRNNDILQISVPEAIVQHDMDGCCFTCAVDALPYQAVAIGPGIGGESLTMVALEEQLGMLKGKPCVLDADALNILGMRRELQNLLPEDAVLTPHPAEYKRLAGDEAPDAYARRRGVILVQKGHPTRIYMPDGSFVSCPFGNNGMGTAGSGDVLTGIIVGLLSQGYPQRDAAVLGVFLHALAGDAAARVKGEHSLIASDIVDFLPQAFRVLAEGVEI